MSNFWELASKVASHYGWWLLQSSQLQQKTPIPTLRDEDSMITWCILFITYGNSPEQGNCEATHIKESTIHKRMAVPSINLKIYDTTRLIVGQVKDLVCPQYRNE